jgi:ornithine racemase
LKRIKFAGIGVNLACFGGIKPNDEKMEYLSSIVKEIEDKFKLKLEIISGGNSANYNWFISTNDIGKINNLRLGESIFLGCETLERKQIPGLFTDAFTLIAEVIESKIKPSLPYGDIGQDAFGNIPKFTDLGLMKRAILGIGLQDVLVSGLMPLLNIDILGASSDHIIIDAKQLEIKVGDTIGFNLNYGALLSSMTSPYIIKTYKKI